MHPHWYGHLADIQHSTHFPLSCNRHLSGSHTPLTGSPLGIRQMDSTSHFLHTTSTPSAFRVLYHTSLTGTPLGIWQMDSSASTPSRLHPAGFTGTPMTGRGVMAAVMPGRWAAPPVECGARPDTSAHTAFVITNDVVPFINQPSR